MMEKGDFQGKKEAARHHVTVNLPRNAALGCRSPEAFALSYSVIRQVKYPNAVI